MGDKKIKVTLDIDSNIEPSIQNLKQLKKQLREVVAGSEEFNKIKKRIKDVEDGLEEATVGAKGFVDQLEETPGVVGQIASSFRKLEIATKSFGAAFKAIGIGLLVSLIGGIAAAFAKSEESVKKFEPLMIGLEKILNGLLGAIQPLIDGFIEFATRALPLVSQAFKVVYSSLTAVLQGLGKLGSAVTKFIKGDFKGAWDDAKSSVSDFGKRYTEASDRFEEGTKKLTKTQKENLDEQKKDRDKAVQDRKDALKEIADAEKEGYLQTLTTQEQEIYKVNEKYVRLLALATKYGQDTVALRQAQQTEIDAINKKFTDEELEKKKKADEDFLNFEIKLRDDLQKIEDDKLKKAEEAAKFQIEQFKKIKEYEEQTAEDTFKTNQIVAQSWVELGNNISNVFGSLINVFEQGSDMAKAFGIAQVAINAASSIGQILVNSKAAGFEYDKAIATGNAAIISSIPKLVNPVTAALGIAEASAGKAAVGAGVAGKAALKTNTALQIGAVGVSSAAQIAAILSARKSQSSGAGTSTSAGSTTTPSPTFGGVPSISAPQIQTGGGINPTQQIGETLANVTNKPVRAYVVSQDISSQQALDRRTSVAATFG